MSTRNLPPIVRITGGTFFRQHPSIQTQDSNSPLFDRLSYEVPSGTTARQNWGIVGPSQSGKTTLLDILRGRFICQPATARSFPFLTSKSTWCRCSSPETAIRCVGFGTERNAARTGSSDGITTAYLSARYESRREKTDFTLRDYLLGNMELNPLEKTSEGDGAALQLFQKTAADLRLDSLLDLPIAFLSNGQGRRARIAKALLQAPELLLLDEPFMGLDPPTVRNLSRLLGSLADQAKPRIILSARPQDELPDWITHTIVLQEGCRIESLGLRGKATARRTEGGRRGGRRSLARSTLPAATDGAEAVEGREPLVEMEGCQVRYGDKVVVGNWSKASAGGRKVGLFWTVRRGERWGVFGPNGSGKTTVVSLLCSDHPQAYSLPIKLFGRPRLPEPGSGKRPMTFWDIQSRIGQSSPEVHQHMPRHLTIRQVVESAWADTFRGWPSLDSVSAARVPSFLRFFSRELNPAHATTDKTSLDWADSFVFGEVPFSTQRVALFLRAVVKSPDIVILDEAFSGMDDHVRDKCMKFLEVGVRGHHDEDVMFGGLSDEQALICISHVKEEVPGCARQWLCLPEANSNQPARQGILDRPMKSHPTAWSTIWDLKGVAPDENHRSPP